MHELTGSSGRVTVGLPATQVDQDVEFSMPMTTAVHQAICEMTALVMNRMRTRSRQRPGSASSSETPRGASVHRVTATPLSESTSTAPSLTSVSGAVEVGLQQCAAREQADEADPDRQLVA